MVRGAFPASAQDDLEVVLHLLPPGDYNSDPRLAGTGNERGRWAVIENQRVQAFYRIYNASLSPRPRGLTADQIQILGCLYTRHRDGFVRQRYIDDLVSVPTAWTPMFVLQLLGEYVVEIAAALKDRIAKLDPASFTAFSEVNRDFVVDLREDRELLAVLLHLDGFGRVPGVPSDEKPRPVGWSARRPLAQGAELGRNRVIEIRPGVDPRRQRTRFEVSAAVLKSSQ